jgi:hypothetical protein
MKRLAAILLIAFAVALGTAGTAQAHDRYYRSYSSSHCYPRHYSSGYCAPPVYYRQSYCAPPVYYYSQPRYYQSYNCAPRYYSRPSCSYGGSGFSIFFRR